MPPAVRRRLLALPYLCATVRTVGCPRDVPFPPRWSLLERLSARPIFLFYGVHGRAGAGRICGEKKSFLVGPAGLRSSCGRALVACLLMAPAPSPAFSLLVAHDTRWYNLTLIPALAGDRNPRRDHRIASWTLYGHSRQSLLASLLPSCFTRHKPMSRSWPSLLALPSAWVGPTSLLARVPTGNTRRLSALFASRDLGGAAGGCLMILAPTELFAIAIAGAAGFHSARLGLSRSPRPGPRGSASKSSANRGNVHGWSHRHAAVAGLLEASAASGGSLSIRPLRVHAAAIRSWRVSSLSTHARGGPDRG